MFAQGVVKSRDPEIMRVFAGYVASILGGEMNITQQMRLLMLQNVTSLQQEQRLLLTL